MSVQVCDGIEKTNEYEPLAKEALKLARNALLVNLRFMNGAFAQIHPLAELGVDFSTDGYYLRYDPEAVTRLFAQSQHMLSRAYLHMVLHNVFLHLYPPEEVLKSTRAQQDKDSLALQDRVSAEGQEQLMRQDEEHDWNTLEELAWYTACDIVVEHTINELNLSSTQTDMGARQHQVVQRLLPKVKYLTAEMLYRTFLDEGVSVDELEALRAPFVVDTHKQWCLKFGEEREAAAATEGQIEESTGRATYAKQTAGEETMDIELPEEAQKTARSAQKQRSSVRGMPGEDITKKEAPQELHATSAGRFSDTVNIDRTKDTWEKAAYELGVELDAYIAKYGAQGSNLAMNLAYVTREKRDYNAFLRKFAHRGEEIHINDEEFDYVYYCYGMERYGNMPLIEPLEYTERKLIRDFVIAIDTSSSTKDGLVRKFIERTYSILCEEANFFTEINLLIVQCDAGITDVAHLTKLKEVEDYLEYLEIKGLGGTDFRPVFDLVERYLDEGFFHDLGGLIYFTDGQGTYPAKKPAFETAFAFVEDTAVFAEVPSWAMKVTLEERAFVDEVQRDNY